MCRRDISSYLSRQLLLCVFVNKYFCLEKLVSVRSFSVGLFRSVQVKNPRLFLICSIDVRERERGVTDSILLRRVVFMRLSMVRSSMLGNLLYDWWTVGARREHIFTLFDVAQGGSNEHDSLNLCVVVIKSTNSVRIQCECWTNMNAIRNEIEISEKILALITKMNSSGFVFAGIFVVGL